MKEHLLHLLADCAWTYCPGSGSLQSLYYEDATHRYLITCSGYALRVAVVNKQEHRFEYCLTSTVSLLFATRSRQLYQQARRVIAQHTSYGQVAGLIPQLA